MNPLGKLELYGIALLVFLAVAAGTYAIGHHNGWREREDKDAAAIVELQDKANAETEKLRTRAYDAEHTHDEELVDLRAYRYDHPLHGGLCLNGGAGNLSEARAADGKDGHAGAGSATVQPLPSGDPGSRRSAEPDIRHLFDLFASRGDQVSAQLREWQTH